MAGRIVMITGAAGNLGGAVAEAFGRAGDTLVLVGRNQESLEQAFGKEDSKRLFMAVDLLQPTQVETGVQRCIGRLGGIDVLCNLAGGFLMGQPVHATSDANWQRMQDLNVRTLLNACHAVVPGMLTKGRGKIVNVGAHSALRGVAQMGAYTAAKSEVMRLTEAMAAELREHGINVNCVLPSTMDTPENRADMPRADYRKWVPPARLASVIAFLASDEASAVHGACIPVVGLS